MAILSIPEAQQKLNSATEIAAYLNARGILYEQWEASVPFAADADQETILNAYRHKLEPYMQAHGYKTADVINVNPDTPNLEAIRAKFLKEHTHSEDEIRFFVEGQGYFWFNLENNEPVFCVKCEAGDFLSVPAGYKHWFDLGPVAHVKTIRVFTDEAGWVPNYTGSAVAEHFNTEMVDGRSLHSAGY